MKGLVFNEETHTYFFDGVQVPGVTSILAPLSDFSMVPKVVLERASQFGKAVHKMVELYCHKYLDEDSLDPALEPYLEAWVSFVDDHKVTTDFVEQPMYHKVYRFAGTPDVIGMVDGERSIIDIKSTAALYPSVGPQVWAYAELAKNNSMPTTGRYAVRLCPDATYELKRFPDQGDFSIFASLLTLRNWCKQHNITPNFPE